MVEALEAKIQQADSERKKKREEIALKLQQLQARQESKELDSETFHLEGFYYINDEDYQNRPVDRKDLKDREEKLHAVVLTYEELKEIGPVEYYTNSGDTIMLVLEEVDGELKEMTYLELKDGDLHLFREISLGNPEQMSEEELKEVVLLLFPEDLGVLPDIG